MLFASLSSQSPSLVENPSDAQSALVPAEWTPGDDLLAVPSQALADVFAADTATDWFYAPVKDEG